jgi:hypothetical protein
MLYELRVSSWLGTDQSLGEDYKFWNSLLHSAASIFSYTHTKDIIHGDLL